MNKSCNHCDEIKHISNFKWLYSRDKSKKWRANDCADCVNMMNYNRRLINMKNKGMNGIINCKDCGRLYKRSNIREVCKHCYKKDEK